MADIESIHDVLVQKRRPITEAEEKQISALLSSAEADLKEYEAEIERIMAAASLAFEFKRDMMKKEVEKYKSLRSPIRRLSPESLSRIFSWTCQDNYHWSDPYVTPEVMTLSAVCGRWRELTLSSPSLWSSFHIVLEEDTVYGEEEEDMILLEKVKLFLERSGTHPMSVYFGLAFDPSGMDMVEESIRRICEQSRRWKDLIIRLACARLPHIFHIMTDKLDALETLQVECDDDDDPVVLDVLGRMSSLAFLDLRNAVSSFLDPETLPKPAISSL